MSELKEYGYTEGCAGCEYRRKGSVHLSHPLITTRLADVALRSIFHNHPKAGLSLTKPEIVQPNDLLAWVIPMVVLMVNLVVLIVLVVPMGRG